LLYLILLLPIVQTGLASILTKKLGESLQTEISIGKVHFIPFRSLKLNDVLIYDQHKDTLAYIQKLNTSIHYISFQDNTIHLNEVSVEEPSIKIYKKDSLYNYNFLYQLKSDTSTTKAWKIDVKNINIKNGKASFNDPSTLKHPIHIKNLNTSLSELKLDSTICINIDSISCSEKSGFEIQKTSGKITLQPQHLFISDLNLHTNHSRLNLDSLALVFPHLMTPENWLDHFYINIEKSKLSPNDINYFLKDKNLLNIPVFASGKFHGNINNIKGSNLRLEFGNDSYLSANLDINGLPNIDQTFIYLDINTLKTSPKELQTILNLSNNVSLKLPDPILNLDHIRFSGDLTGFISNMVAYGKLETPLGTIKSDINLKTDKKNKLSFAGSLKTQQFDIGALLGAQEKIGKATMSLAIKGYRQHGQTYNSFMKGTIDSLSLLGYQYKNIQLNGLFANKKFDGEFLVNDPNGLISFEGKIDFSEEIREFDFRAALFDIRLDKLNLVKTAKDSHLFMELNSNFKGNSINDITGFLNIKDAKFESPKQNITMDSLTIVSVRENNEKHIILQSDILEGDLIGRYNFTSFASYFLENIVYHAPTLSHFIKTNNHPEHINNFVFSCQFKKINQLTNLLFPTVDISDEGIILGKVNTNERKFDIEADFEYCNINNTSIEKPEFHLNSNNTNFTLLSQFKKIKHDNLSTFENLNIHNSIQNDSITLNVFWNNWGETSNSGSIFTRTALDHNEYGLLTSTIIDPSYLMIKDSLWEIKSCQFNYHSDGFNVADFKLQHNNQAIGINGQLHKKDKDGLHLSFQNIKLEDLLHYQDSEISASGTINGDVTIKDAYRMPILTTDLEIKNCAFNKDTIGDFYLNSEYLPEIKSLQIKTEARKNNYYPLKGGGIIDLAAQTIDLNYKIDRIPVGFLNLYLGIILQNISGTASGDMAIKGPLNAPQLIGRVKANQIHVDINILNTTYEVNDSAYFDENIMIFDHMRVTDTYGNKGSFYGTIGHTNFDAWTYDLTVDAKNILALNTTKTENTAFYGTVFADGNLSIEGTNDDLRMDITAKTKRNTEFSIPLESRDEVQSANFIQFSSESKDEKTSNKASNKDDYEVEISGVTLNMEIEVTPDAKNQVIFDSTYGDILKGVGKGDIHIQMNKQGQVQLFGGFKFDEGEYMFTLQNVINKRFSINSGSSIIWDGNPYDAIIDLKATYKLKTSIKDLVPAYLTDESSGDIYSRRIPINCNLLLKDRLLNPAIQFEILSPGTQQHNQDIIDAAINTEEELNKQVLSLLIINRFFASQEKKSETDNNRANSSSAALVTTSEVLTSQLNNWLSQISDDFDIGINFRPGDEVKEEEIEVALSTQMFNNRVTLNGNVGYGEDETRPSKLIGDFDMSVKLNKSGKIQAKAYTRTNNDLLYTTSPTTQGVGLSYKEEFNTIGELMTYYWNKLTWWRKDEDETGSD